MALIDHHCLSTADEINQICQQDLLNRFNLNYFQYGRCYADGSIFMLGNHKAWFETAYKIYTHRKQPDIYNHVYDNVMQPHQFKFLWQNNIPDEILNLAKEHSDITNGIVFVERHKDYYDLIGFGAPSNNHNIYETYINKQDELEKFIIRFRSENKDLFINAEKNKLLLPHDHRDDNLTTLLADDDNHYLSQRELEILKLLKMGVPRKIIANELSLSVRTVETHLNRLKQRFDKFNANDLLALI